MQTPIDIGSALIEARRRGGVTQRELADRLGVKQPQIARWEANAYRTASLERVDAVARALGVELGGVRSLPVAAESGVAYSVAPRTPEQMLERIGVEKRRLATISRRHAIAELALFGSILGEEFGRDSDVDVLVRFADGEQPDLGELLDIEEELRTLFGRDVDLVERSVVERSGNYVRRRHILGTARTVYVA